MDICCVPVWLCSLNLTILLFSNFTNTNMSPCFSILMIKIRIWISPGPVFTGPSIKFDWVWPTLTKLWVPLSLNPTVSLWPEFTGINHSLHFSKPKVRFQIKGWRVMDICFVPLRLCFLNLTIQLFSNFTNTNMSPYSSIPTIKIRTWISPSPMVIGPFNLFNRVWLSLTKCWPRIFWN